MALKSVFNIIFFHREKKGAGQRQSNRQAGPGDPPVSDTARAGIGRARVSPPRWLTGAIPARGGSGGAGQGHGRPQGSEAELGEVAALPGTAYSGGATHGCGGSSTASSPAAFQATPGSGEGGYGLLRLPIGGQGG